MPGPEGGPFSRREAGEGEAEGREEGQGDGRDGGLEREKREEGKRKEGERKEGERKRLKKEVEVSDGDSSWKKKGESNIFPLS